MKNHTFEIKETFYLDGEPFQIISGGMHYFRVVPEYWEDRLKKLKALGCNTVETYIPWNLHEKEKGRFNFSGILDIKRFVLLAQELGLYVILRPSPYICAEWEFGGLPYWLLKEDDMHLRCSYEPYLNHVKAYYDRLFQEIAPLQITQGGPVILMQVENEYGYYGDDTAYLEWLKKQMILHGCEVPLVTSDGPWGEAFKYGKIDGVLQTGNFGSKTKQQFAFMKERIGDKPLMCMEFWVGWFDAWDAAHDAGNLEDMVEDLDEILKQGNLNIYMFEGGTNFGFMNGANYYDHLLPDVTSYDYDALLTEDGRITEKYKAFQKKIYDHLGKSNPQILETTKSVEYGKIQCTKSASLFDNLENLSTPISMKTPVSMEKLGQGYGYTLYRSHLKNGSKVEKIRLNKANDRAKIYQDDEELATLYDKELLETYEIPETNRSDEEPAMERQTKQRKIDILMENMGRVNFSSVMEQQRKGIDGSVLINERIHYDWEIYPLSLESVDALDYTKEAKKDLPGFYQFEFEVTEKGDTFLDFTGWGKGVAFVNGHNIGRFWEVGPQKRLYIPAPFLTEGKNEIVLFETEGKVNHWISLEKHAKLS